MASRFNVFRFPAPAKPKFKALSTALAVLMVAAACAVMIPRPAAANSAIDGWWIDAAGDAGILIAPCGDKLCGTIRWLKQPLDAKTGKPETDTANPNAALQSRAICGLTMLWNFTQAAPDKWTGGEIYDPVSGNTYKSHMKLLPDHTLSVRGYIGISLLGRSEIWTHPSSPPAPCSE